MGLMFLISAMHLTSEKALCNAMYLKPEGQVLMRVAECSLLKSVKCIVSEKSPELNLDEDITLSGQLIFV